MLYIAKLRAAAALVAAVTFVAGVLVWCGAGCTPAAPGNEEEPLLVLQPPDEGGKGAAKPMAPFEYEGRADVIAVGVMGRNVKQRGRTLIRLELTEILKGKQDLGPIAAADGTVPFGCLAPKNPKKFSQLYEQGTRVAVLLRKDPKAGWAIVNLSRLTEESEPKWRQRIEPFLAVLAAAQAEDPARRYQELLPGDGEILLSCAAYSALYRNPDPKAAEAVCRLLQKSAARTDMDRRRQGEYGNPANLVELLNRMCDRADAATIRHVRTEMKRAIDAYQGKKNYFYYENLVKAHEALAGKTEE